mmetsp:Transcript_47568/g.154398  ORF Transcript_47568/g.154398 Transcript_47568/m.154398 type:complete len:267 (+) Transcript_47568:200-1000(+)
MGARQVGRSLDAQKRAGAGRRRALLAGPQRHRGAAASAARGGHRARVPCQVDPAGWARGGRPGVQYRLHLARDHGPGGGAGRAHRRPRPPDDGAAACRCAVGLALQRGPAGGRPEDGPIPARGAAKLLCLRRDDAADCDDRRGRARRARTATRAADQGDRDHLHLRARLARQQSDAWAAAHRLLPRPGRRLHGRPEPRGTRGVAPRARAKRPYHGRRRASLRLDLHEIVSSQCARLPPCPAASLARATCWNELSRARHAAHVASYV